MDIWIRYAMRNEAKLVLAENKGKKIPHNNKDEEKYPQGGIA